MSNLLESQFGEIRITKINGIEYGSVYDALQWIGISNNNTKRSIFKRLKNDFPDVVAKCNDFKFEGKGQKNTPVADLQTLLQICGKTRQRYKIDNAAYETLTNILTNPIKTVEKIDKIHGKGTEKRTVDYLDSFHGLNKSLDNRI